MESPAFCELIRRVREFRAERTTTVDEISPPGDSASNWIAERDILTVGRLVRTTKAVVEENVLGGRDAGPRLTAWMVHHAAEVICACMVGAVSRRSREPALPTDGKSCHRKILAQPPTWSQRLQNSHVRLELGRRSIPLHNVWRGIRLMLSLKQSDFLAHGTSDRCPGGRVLINGGRAQGHTEECRIRVEGEIRKTEGKLVFVLQPVEWVMLPQGVN